MKIELKDPSHYAKERTGIAELTLRATDRNVSGFRSRIGSILMTLKERDTIALHGINSDNWKELLSKPELSRYVKHGESESIVAFAERSGLTPFLTAVHAENLVMVIGPSQLPLAHIEGTLKKAGQWWKLQSVDSVKLWIKDLPANCILIFFSYDHLSVEFYGDSLTIQAISEQARAWK